jgi:hypothetical protein
MSCELKESEFSKKFNVPFFTMYQLYTDYSGQKWMDVKYSEIHGTKIHYIKQNTPPQNEIKNDYGKQDSSFDTIFMPHYWNKTGLVPGNKRGNLQIYYIANNGSFVNLSNDETKIKPDETMQHYNDTKSYIVHNGPQLLLSDSQKIPELLMNKILSHTRLFLSFNWKDEPDMFYGIYDFVDSEWKIENGEYKHLTLGNVTISTTEICKAMDDFVTYIHSGIQPSSAGSASNINHPASVNNNYQNSSSNINQTTSVAVAKPNPTPAPSTTVAVAKPNPTPAPSTTVAVSTPVPNPNPPPPPSTTVAVSNPNPNPDPSTTVAVTPPVTTTTVAVTPPVTTTTVAVSNPNPNPVTTPDPTTTVAVSNPATNSMMMPQFGNTNQIYIKVIFDGIVPKTVDVVDEFTVTSLEGDIDIYIDGLLDGTKKSNEKPVYFVLDKSYAESIVNMSSQ